MVLIVWVDIFSSQPVERGYAWGLLFLIFVFGVISMFVDIVIYFYLFNFLNLLMVCVSSIYITCILVTV